MTIAQTERAAGIEAPAAGRAILLAPSKDERRLAMRIAQALRAAGHRAAVDTGRRRSAAALERYAGDIGCAGVLMIDAKGGRVLPINGADDGAVSSAALKRAARGDVAELVAAVNPSNAEEA